VRYRQIAFETNSSFLSKGLSCFCVLFVIIPAFDMAPIHRQTSTVDAYDQSVSSMVDLRFVFAARLLGRIEVRPMLRVISLGPTFLVYRALTGFRMASVDQSSSAQPVISLCSLRKGQEGHTTRRSFHCGCRASWRIARLKTRWEVSDSVIFVLRYFR